ncbi:prolyl oligopeptidase family serine peptidase [Novosphingobium album (ex Liu et al. 2023)]|uniref:Prolyl oligopeptidase family serine peptidase n=1 Tax=Novosphingobium album (ex Liu et al. 2023) TaxID=3031130 RepID=A0ABT5WLJ6_9SPHN|nr:prolyl oligopeptidase family serine peptidase [Novosphingobium album (ex Liu et al. 2023)]MDE8650918.1 prolyl oligopeptidase family serine peptidase [Novosphingobium album (ex Liu et al. 2023)]
MSLSHKLLVTAALAAAPLLMAATGAPDDPYVWLEDIHGEKAIAQVEAWNAATMKALAAMPGYEADRARARAILDDESQIAEPGEVMGDAVTNLWRDAAHPRGLWRAASLASFLAGKPEWQTLIDVDALGKAEGKSWVWHGAECLAPEYRRCLVSLSPGGTDAEVVREWDRATGRFVPGGFTLPEAKSVVTWEDVDTLLVATDFGPGTMTASGYPRMVRRWRRGTPLAAASVIKEGLAEDITLSPFALMDGKTRRLFVQRGKTFYTSELWLAGPDGRLLPTPLPETADPRGILAGRLIAFLNKPLGTVPAGSLVAWPIADILAGAAGAPQAVFTPGAGQAIEDVGTTDSVLWIKLLDDVSGRLIALRPGADGAWSRTVAALPDKATIHLVSGADAKDMAFATVESFLVPPTLFAVAATGQAQALQSLPAKFDAARFDVAQHFAVSKDGTKVPYFLAIRKGVKGPVPALIHAYGGFRVAQTPTYLTTEPYRAGPLALDWVDDGNAYVLANIRGGGEYGPAWHEAALREKRQNAYDDLYAVAEDMVARGLSARGRIAVSGRSNGGLMAGVAITQRPDLFGGGIVGSPLLDMKRYSHLLAGASWMAEYGDPDLPADWAFIGAYSPYQALRKGVKYPPVFFYSSTEDDRVHPGHARKMAARLAEYGNAFYFHEYREGGHSVGADHAEDAVRAALLHAYLKTVLTGEGAGAKRP